MSRWKEAAHLIRPALVFLALSVVFLLVRRAVVPASFGQFGHYRGAALEEVRKSPIRFAGQQACADCHPEVVTARAKGHHRGVACETCHGPLNKHAQDPSLPKPAKPVVTVLCRTCHEKDSAKPAFLKQVVAAEHAGDAACQSCHNAHTPKL